MQLHQFKPNHKFKGKKRIARGGKRGTTSGRGQKGQKSRAGAKIRPAEQDLIIRIPKRKGFRNRSVWAKPLIINLDELGKLFDDNQIVNQKSLQEKGFIRKTSQKVKILGAGEIKKKLEIEGVELSQGAKEKIKAAGGKINKDE